MSRAENCRLTFAAAQWARPWGISCQFPYICTFPGWNTLSTGSAERSTTNAAVSKLRFWSNFFIIEFWRKNICRSSKSSPYQMVAKVGAFQRAVDHLSIYYLFQTPTRRKFKFLQFSSITRRDPKWREIWNLKIRFPQCARQDLSFEPSFNTMRLVTRENDAVTAVPGKFTKKSDDFKKCFLLHISRYVHFCRTSRH